MTNDTRLQSIQHGRGFALTAGLALALGAGAANAQTDDCAPADGAEFVCGVANIEKLIKIEGTELGIGSALIGGPLERPPLYIFDFENQSAHPVKPKDFKVEPDETSYPDCGVPDFSKFVSLGIDIATIDEQEMVYVVNHGEGYTIELFDMERGDGLPQLTWIGCVTTPDETFWPDDLVILKDGGMIVTSLFDPTDPAYASKLSAGEPHGALGEWHPDTGWTMLAEGKLSGPNGIIISPDESQLFVADYGARNIARIDRDSGEIARAKLDFHVDNVSWTEDVRAIIGVGSAATPQEGFACFGTDAANCTLPFKGVLMDPETLEVAELLPAGTLGIFGGGSGAVQDGDHLWLTSWRADRIAKVPFFR